MAKDTATGSSTKGSKETATTKQTKETKETTTKETKEATAKPTDGKPNKATRDANLNFNVMAFKKFIKDFCVGVLGLKKEDVPQLHNAQVAIAAFNEALCHSILEATKATVTKDKSELYEVSRGAVRQAVERNSELDSAFGRFMRDKYDGDMNYSSQFCLEQKDMDTYMDTVLGANFKLTSKAYNLIVFLLMKMSGVVIKTAYKVTQYAKKKSLDGKSIMTACDIVFDESSSLRKTVTMKIEEAVTAVGGKVETSDEDGAPENDDDEEAEETKEATTKETSTKKSKTSSSKTEKVEVEDVEDDEEDAEEEVEEEDTKPAAKKGKGGEKKTLNKSTTKK